MSIANSDDIMAVQTAIYAALDELEKMADQYSEAKQILEYDSDRRKSALSRAMDGMLEAGMSVAAAEHRARASAFYNKDMELLKEQFISATKLTERHWHLMTRIDALRSILSTQKIMIDKI